MLHNCTGYLLIEPVIELLSDMAEPVRRYSSTIVACGVTEFVDCELRVGPAALAYHCEFLQSPSVRITLLCHFPDFTFFLNNFSHLLFFIQFPYVGGGDLANHSFHSKY